MRHLVLKLCMLMTGVGFISCTPKEMNDIYLCGNSSPQRAFYMVNGHKVELSPNSYEAQVIDMEVANGNVYCAGYIRERNDGKAIAVIWKNGVARRITDGSCSAYIEDMYVADDIVCCVGREADGPKMKEPRKQYSFYDYVVQHDRAKAWIIQGDNPIKELVLTNGKYNASVKSVYIDSDRRLHLVGYDEGVRAALIGTVDAYFQTRYWLLSGEDWKLIQEATVFNRCGQATLIFGADSDLYICGWVDYDLHSTDGINATYWHNEWEKKLPENYEVIIKDGCVNGADWYMCGYKDDSGSTHAVYYKNGQIVRVADKESPIESKILGMDILGNDVYMAGYRGGQPGYWKNDKFVPLKDEEMAGGVLTGIVVLRPKQK